MRPVTGGIVRGKEQEKYEVSDRSAVIKAQARWSRVEREYVN